MKNSKVSNNFFSAVRIFRKHPLHIFIIVLLQFAFLVVLSWSALQVFKTLETEMALNEVLVNNAQGLQEEDVFMLEERLSQDPAYSDTIKQTLQIVAFTIAIMILGWFLLIIPCWFVAHLAVRKTSWKVLPKLWLIALIGLILLSVLKLTFLLSSGFIKFFAVLLLILAYYLLYSSFSSANLKFGKSFINGFSKAKSLIPAMLINLLILFNTAAPGVIWWFKDVRIALVLFVLLFFPALAFARIHLVIASTWQRT